MKSNYNEKRENRIEAFERLAAKNDKLSESLYNRAKSMADCIPFGQPILVGHHSERGDRNFRAKIHNTFGKSFEASEKSEYYANRAESAKTNDSISSDNPEAIKLLEDKLAKLEKNQELMKAANKIIKGKGDKLAGLVALGLTENQANKLLEPDFCGRVGFASFSLTNNSANIRNTKQRIEQLKKQQEREDISVQIGSVKIETSKEHNRILIHFPGKPSESIRSLLKSSGYRWAPSIGAWVAYINRWNFDKAKQIATEYEN